MGRLCRLSRCKNMLPKPAKPLLMPLLVLLACFYCYPLHGNSISKGDTARIQNFQYFAVSFIFNLWIMCPTIEKLSICCLLKKRARACQHDTCKVMPLIKPYNPEWKAYISWVCVSAWQPKLEGKLFIFGPGVVQ